MKKAIFMIVVFAVFLISVSAHTSKVIDSSEGYVAPFFSIERNDTSVSLDEFKGKYVLLTFWASKDAKSRIKCREYTSFVGDLNLENQFSQLSINFDCSERLFNEIVKLDKLDAQTQFYAQGDKALQLIREYRLEDGYHSFLIDKQGKIIEKNPTITSLKKIFKY